VANFEPLGILGLKGLGDVEAWRFTAFAASDRVLQVAFVGRDPELRILRDAYDRASHGVATLALLIGPPGRGRAALPLRRSACRRRLGSSTRAVGPARRRAPTPRFASS
jgi:hypothetical protein